MNDLIGFWVARFTLGDLHPEAFGKRLTKYHLIESEIADRKITRCGRQLHHRDGTALTVIVGPPPPREGCQRCVS